MRKAAVDAKDRPLDILRETLRQHRILRVIENHLVKTCFEISTDITEKKDDHKKFYEQFGMCINFGSVSRRIPPTV